MPIRAVCPGCGAAFNVREEASGRKVRCTRCQAVFLPNPETLPREEEPAEEEPRLARRRPRRDSPGPPPDEDEGDDRPRRRRRGKKRASYGVLGYLAFIGIVLAGLAVCGVAGWLIYHFMVLAEVEEPITEADKAVLLTADQVASQVSDLQVQPSLGKLRKVRERLGSHVLRYEYGTPDGAQGLAGKRGLYLQCVVTVAPRESDAHSAYIRLSTELNLGSAWDSSKGIKRADRSEVLRWGEDSTCVVLSRGIEPVGHLFTGRRGKRVFHLVMLGTAFRNPGALRDLLSPILRRLDSYNP